MTGSIHPCSECGGRLVGKRVSQNFERGGIRVKLSGIKALVCRKCGDIYFLPGGADKVAKAANCLFELASVERQYKTTLVGEISTR